MWITRVERFGRAMGGHDDTGWVGGGLGTRVKGHDARPRKGVETRARKHTQYLFSQSARNGNGTGGNAMKTNG